ncbi:bifunctional diguanylate cyclase/phosphodiesterase [Quadrisphaera sp. DSM 44207]|uniref:putative bifunctional diguanylate cyclase/phosphodiesterase n=1 Tax=Quadrisphaera sp. DSM 44207 TaxID=1881057 RepID=UPI000886B1CD|nr:bifunctional diguanylate cyclase/phosphodiesterase [Quadrisphaera sp. DSM 44207]SDQ06050.1 diguanylate cyclase (GGDEF) domain-containing protein [Quadrisphaera sp. DSM 44207]
MGIDWITVATAAAAALVLVAPLLAVMVRQHRRHARAARTDPLTGLGNRTLLAQAAERVLGGLAGPGSPADPHGDGTRGPAVLLLDLDGFKDVNDTLGHHAGDELLTQVARRLEAVAGADAVVTRLGGDEFAVLLTAPVTTSQAVLHAKRLLAALGAGGFTARDIDLDIAGSIGVAVAPGAGRTVGDLLRRADQAMYEAKRSRAGVCAATAALVPETADGLTTLALLRGAMEHGQLSLVYQPVVEAGTGQLVGFEALLRWQHPTRGVLLPAEFLPLAERTSLIRPLTRWVLLTAVRQAADWRRAGLDTSIAVNVSASVLEPGLLGIVEEALALNSWPAEQLVLEVTESALAADAQEAREVILALSARGLPVSIDDFGAGYTSLGQLRGLPVRQLKIDRQFVTCMLEAPDDAAITASIIDLGHRLGLRVVAEGVESPGTTDRLRDLGCDHLQGFSISRPVSAAAALEAWRSARPTPLP